MEYLSVNTTLNCNGTLLSLEKPIVMGILNVTPDSFFDGGKYSSNALIMRQVEKILNEGAAIIDIGGVSSKPGATFVAETEEFARVLPVLEAINKEFSEAILSVDTWRASVAKASVEAGASMINDISGGQYDENLFETVGKLQVPFVLMHIKGTPETMQNKPSYDNLKEEILTYFVEKIEKLRHFGVKDIVLDVGFGFGKSIDDNYDLLKNLHIFNLLGLPQLVGISRKSMIYKYLDITPQEALSATSALHLAALQQGAKILRAHDVKEAVEVVKLFGMLES